MARVIFSVMIGMTLLQGDARKPLSDEEWRLLSKAVYKCGQITADRQWIDVIDASRSKVTFQIDRTKSERDYQVNHCDDVLRLTGASQQ